MLAPELLRNRVSPRPGPGRRNLTNEATEAPQAHLVPPGHNRKSFYWLPLSDRRISVLGRPGKNLLASPLGFLGQELFNLHAVTEPIRSPPTTGQPSSLAAPASLPIT